MITADMHILLIYQVAEASSADRRKRPNGADESNRFFPEKESIRIANQNGLSERVSILERRNRLPRKPQAKFLDTPLGCIA